MPYCEADERTRTADPFITRLYPFLTSIRLYTVLLGRSFRIRLERYSTLIPHCAERTIGALSSFPGWRRSWGASRAHTGDSIDLVEELVDLGGVHVGEPALGHLALDDLVNGEPRATRRRAAHAGVLAGADPDGRGRRRRAHWRLEAPSEIPRPSGRSGGFASAWEEACRWGER